MEKHERLGKFLEKAAASKKKDEKLGVRIIKACDLDPIEFLPTGIELFDAVVGGIPRGKFTLVFGGEGVGKTTWGLTVAGNVIENKGSVMVMEPENRADKTYWNKFMDTEKVYVSQATSLGACLDSLVTIVESGTCDLILVDSLAALAVKELRGKGAEGDHMALMARRLPQFFQIATEIVATTKTAVVFIHQKRDVLDMFASELEAYSGGNHLKHMNSLVLNLRRASTSKDPDKGERFKGANNSRTGFMTNFRAVKSTVGTITEGQAFQLDFMKYKGIFQSQSIVIYSIKNKVINKLSPGKYIFTDDKGTYEQTGLMNVIKDVGNTVNLRQRILAKCRKFMWEDPTAVTDFEPDIVYEASQVNSKKKEVDDDAVKGKETPKEQENSKSKSK